MTSQELIDFFRKLTADNTPPYLWSDSLLVSLGAEAEKQAARRARLLVDSSTEDLCLFDVVKDTRMITLDKRIIFVRRVKLASKDLPLQKIHRRDLDMLAPGWEDEAASDTCNYCTNYETGKMVFHTALPADDTVRLTVVREPLAALALSGPAVNPEIAPRYVEKLVDWMIYRAYNLRDVEEKYDPVVAAAGLARFESEFGPESTAQNEKWFQDEHGYDEYEGLY